MKKFILFKNESEVKKVYEGCTLDVRDYYPIEIRTFDNKDEALEELKEYETSVQDRIKYYLVEEYYVEEQEQDENGEFIDGGDIWEYSKLPDKYAEFYINDTRESGYSFKKYKFEEVKEFFRHKTDDNDNWYTIVQENAKIDACYDLEELIDVLTERNGGMEFTYVIEKC